MTPQLVSVAQAAAFADVSPRTIRRYISEGLLTGYRVGPRLLRVDPAELECLPRPIPTVAMTAAVESGPVSRKTRRTGAA